MAIAIAALLNFVGAFISISVAATVANDVVDAGVITPTIVFAGLIGAIAWNLITWWLRPALQLVARADRRRGRLGGGGGRPRRGARRRAGRQGADSGGDRAHRSPSSSPGVAIGLVYRVVGRQRPGPVTRGFRYGQIVSGGLLALAHGTNDAQKTMGVITLALIANGTLGAETPTRRSG